MTPELLRGRQFLFKDFPINSLSPPGNLLVSQISRKFGAMQWSLRVRLTKLFDSALPRSKADKPCLTYIGCIVSAQFFLYHLSSYTGTLQMLLNRSSTTSVSIMTLNSPSISCVISQNQLGCVASKLTNPARIRSVIQEQASWLQKSIQDHIIYH